MGNESVYKPDPVFDRSNGDHPSGTAVTSSLVRSTSKHKASSPSAWASKLTHLTLLRVGFTELMQSPAPLVVSYTTVSPLPRFPLAVCFLWHYPADRSGWVLPTTLLCEVRTFLDTCMPRSPDRLVHDTGYAVVYLIDTRTHLCVHDAVGCPRDLSPTTE
jgi:hypothetical protein